MLSAASEEAASLFLEGEGAVRGQGRGPAGAGGEAEASMMAGCVCCSESPNESHSKPFPQNDT